MPTAKEMFEELGYEFVAWHRGINYYKTTCDLYEIEYRIQFFDDIKTFACFKNDYGMQIDIPTFQAIHQQMKELGWLDE